MANISLLQTSLDSREPTWTPFKLLPRHKHQPFPHRLEEYNQQLTFLNTDSATEFLLNNYHQKIYVTRRKVHEKNWILWDSKNFEWLGAHLRLRSAFSSKYTKPLPLKKKKKSPKSDK